jgi:hypothetical protein
MQKKATERHKTVISDGKSFHFERDGSITEIKPVKVERLPEFTSFIDLDLSKKMKSETGIIFK